MNIIPNNMADPAEWELENVSAEVISNRVGDGEAPGKDRPADVPVMETDNTETWPSTTVELETGGPPAKDAVMETDMRETSPPTTDETWAVVADELNRAESPSAQSASTENFPSEIKAADDVPAVTAAVDSVPTEAMETDDVPKGAVDSGEMPKGDVETDGVSTPSMGNVDAAPPETAAPTDTVVATTAAVDASRTVTVDGVEMVDTIDVTVDGVEMVDTIDGVPTDAALTEPEAGVDVSVDVGVDDVLVESAELTKYWKSVLDSPTDFTGWTYLLQFVEQESRIEHVRKAFDAFLIRYPYCYGYWKKFADLELKHGNPQTAEEVYERGLDVVSLSIELWIHYINYQSARTDVALKQHDIRQLFERAVQAVGMDFRSDKLWDMYVFWEHENGSPCNVTAIYDQVLAIPTQEYKHHFDRFTQHVKNHSSKEVLSLDEFLKLRLEQFAERAPQTEGSGAATAVAAGGADVDEPGAEEKPPGTDSEKVDEEEEVKLSEKIIELRRAVHIAVEEEVSKRWAFEEAIRRPYFHVKALERAQLRNWRQYLDFEIAGSSHQRIVILFERCLIACALYEEFWLKYASYLECQSPEDVRQVFKRACVHLPSKVQLHLEWAAFEERQGEQGAALRLLSTLQEAVPGVASVALRRINLQRREGNFASVDEMYHSCMEKARTPELSSYFAIKYARYKAKILGNSDDAIATIETALEKDEKNQKLYLQLLDLEYQRPAVDEARMLRLFVRALAAPLSLPQRIAFSQRRVEFLEDFGSSIARVLDAQKELKLLVKEEELTKKRKGTDSNENSVEKKAKSDSSATNGMGYQQPQAQGTSSHMQHGGYGDPNMQYNYSQWPGYSNSSAYNYQQGSWNNYGGYYG